MIRCGHQIRQIGGKIGIGEFTFAGTKTRKIKTQHGDAVFGQRLGDPAGCENILAASEAVRE